MWGGLKPCTGPPALFWFALPGSMKAGQQMYRFNATTLGYSTSGSLCLDEEISLFPGLLSAYGGEMGP